MNPKTQFFAGIFFTVTMAAVGAYVGIAKDVTANSNNIANNKENIVLLREDLRQVQIEIRDKLNTIIRYMEIQEEKEKEKSP